jgi:exodeoxyribonuclease VII large subunit
LPVVVYPAAVQGAQAPAELCAALHTAYRRHAERGESDVLLLVRGGGSLEDLWSFNDETLVRLLAQAPMPVVCGVGHETDFTLADFVADLRAPTPTAAAELCAPAREQREGELRYLQERLQSGVWDGLNVRAQGLDRLAQRLGRPSSRLHENRQRLLDLQHHLQRGVQLAAVKQRNRYEAVAQALPGGLHRALDQQRQRLQRSEHALGLLDPRLVLLRGYAWLADAHGSAVTSVAQVAPGQPLAATLADGRLDLTVSAAARQP